MGRASDGVRPGTDVSARQAVRDPERDLQGCERVLVLGRTGSGKTTLARQLSVALGLPHVELDALYFQPDLSTVPLPVLRQRASQAIAGERWVIDGNKKALRDLVWPRADTVVWLDYPFAVSVWRLGKRMLWRTSVINQRATATSGRSGRVRQLLAAARGVLTALRSHRGQRRRYPLLFAEPQNSHLAVVRLRSPRATQRWLQRVAAD